MKLLIIIIGSLIAAISAKTCNDQNANCKSWKNHCLTNDFVKNYCHKTCGTCNGGGSGASHCVERRKSNPGSMTVVVGAHNKDDRDETTQQRLDVKRIIMNPNYKKGSGLNADIALLELSTPVKFNERVVKSCMPRQGVYPATGKNCYIAGWGTTTHPGKSPSILQQAKLPVVGTPHGGCHNNKEVVCVGYGMGTGPDGKQHPNACRGDSGGPLMCQQSDGRWQVEGVASYVFTYCKYYTAYAPVNKYLSWIKTHVRDL